MAPAKCSWCFCARAVRPLGAATTLRGAHLRSVNAAMRGVAVFSASLSHLRLLGAERVLVSVAFNTYKVLTEAVQLHTCVGQCQSGV